MIQGVIHYGLHLFLPLVVAFFFFKPQWKKATLFMLLAWLIDIDHLWASPIFDPNRCSVGFHFLHTYWAAGVYMIFLLLKPLRFFGIGTLLHLAVDALDCFMMGMSQ